MHYTIAHYDGVSFVYQDQMTLAEFIDRPGIEPGSHRINADLFLAAKRATTDASEPTPAPIATTSPGYACKQCDGPAPVGIGYVDANKPRDESRTACDCGYSVKADAIDLFA